MNPKFYIKILMLMILILPNNGKVNKGVPFLFFKMDD